MDAAHPLAFEERPPHPQASPQLYTLPTRLAHQEIVQHQPWQRQTVETLAIVHKTSPARTAAVIGHAHALQALRGCSQHGLEHPELGQEWGTGRTQIFGTGFITRESGPVHEEYMIALVYREGAH